MGWMLDGHVRNEAAKSVEDVLSARDTSLVTIVQTNIVVNCPDICTPLTEVYRGTAKMNPKCSTDLKSALDLGFSCGPVIAGAFGTRKRRVTDLDSPRVECQVGNLPNTQNVCVSRVSG